MHKTHSICMQFVFHARKLTSFVVGFWLNFEILTVCSYQIRGYSTFNHSAKLTITNLALTVKYRIFPQEHQKLNIWLNLVFKFNLMTRITCSGILAAVVWITCNK